MESLESVTQRFSNDRLEIDEQDVFTVLANERRRLALHFLKREGRTVRIGVMSEQIAAWENDIDKQQVTGSDRKCVYTALLQSHLPKMDRAGVVEFDKDRGTVTPTEAAKEICIYMNVVTGRDIPWGKYYVGLSGVAATIVAAVWTGVWPFTLLPSFAWMLMIVGGFAVSAFAHWYSTDELGSDDIDDPLGFR